MDVNNYTAGTAQLSVPDDKSGHTGISVTVTTSKNGKKSISYNPKEISSQIIRAKKMTGASQALVRARSKVAMLRRAQATGEYDSLELENALMHAERMVECASMKVSNLREEEILKTKLERQEDRKIQEIRNVQRLERIKRNAHRREENSKASKADADYYQNEMKREADNSGSNSDTWITSAAAALELSTTAGDMQSVKLARTAVPQAGAGSTVDVLA